MVFEHDVPLDPDTLGGPVLNLNGQAVGISIAAAGLHASLAIPADPMKTVIARLVRSDKN